jgi:hypothetical protein
VRRFLLIALALVAAGCGQKHEIVHEAETEGIYVDVGNLVYQVQLSRYLNPGDVEDREYLMGLPEGVSSELPGDETWFGVWMRVKNYTDETLTPANSFTIHDTDDNQFLPVSLAETNVFAYRPVPLGPDEVKPRPDTAAASGPIQGSLLLYRLPVESLQNRPLKLVIEQGGVEPAEIDLDL